MPDSLSERLAACCARDGEFQLAARYWTGSLRLDLGDAVANLVLVDGTVSAAPSTDAVAPIGAGHLGVRAPVDLWANILAPIPRPFFNDILPARAFGLTLDGDTETFWQYYPAVRRAVELLREESLA